MTFLKTFLAFVLFLLEIRLSTHLLSQTILKGGENVKKSTDKIKNEYDERKRQDVMVKVFKQNQLRSNVTFKSLSWNTNDLEKVTILKISNAFEVPWHDIILSALLYLYAFLLAYSTQYISQDNQKKNELLHSDYIYNQNVSCKLIFSLTLSKWKRPL